MKGSAIMGVTIKDVAALAGVSPSTVSRTCNNSSLISAKTKEKVRKAMDELGYDGPAIETIQEGEASKGALGVILPSYNDDSYESPFHLDVIRGISKACNMHRYTTCILSAKSEQELLQAIDQLRKSTKNVSFILLYSQEYDTIADFLYDEGLNFVLLGAPLQHDSEIISVDNDNFAAGFDACQYLIDCGHTRIGYVGTDPSLAFSARRRQGYQMAMLENHLDLNPAYCMDYEISSPYFREAIEKMLSHEDHPSALLVVDDIYALAVTQICNELHLKIPEDISIIAFNDSIFTRLSVPPTTCIDIHGRQLGLEAAVQAINHLESPELTSSKVIIPYQIIERDSVKKNS